VEDREAWVKVEFYNLLNNQKLIAWDRTITRKQRTGGDANGLPLNYWRTALRPADQRQPVPAADPGQNGGRLFRMALGVRF